MSSAIGSALPGLLTLTYSSPQPPPTPLPNPHLLLSLTLTYSSPQSSPTPLPNPHLLLSLTLTYSGGSSQPGAKQSSIQVTTTLAATDAHPSKVSAQCGEGGGPATTGRGPERSLSQQALNLRSGTSEARSHAVVVAMGLAVEVYIAGAEHGARHVILTDIIRDKVSSRVRSEMGSHLALFEAGLHYLAERYSGTVELLNARGNLKDEGAAYAGKATELVVLSLCTLLEGGSLWGLNVGEWEFSPEQMQRIHAAARSASCKLCFAFFDAVLVGDEAARVLREDVIRPRRRGTTAAPWLYGDDPEWNAVIGAEDKMWFNPHDLRRNKHAEECPRGGAGS